MKKPPLGIMPKHIHDMNRMLELERAIYRYLDAESVIPVKWIDEYNEFVKRGVFRGRIDKEE